METVLEIHLKHLDHNFKYLKSKIGENTRFLGVVKAFAYGSESVAIAQRLAQLGADYLAVAYTAEGVALRKAGIQLPILVLHPLPSHFGELIDHGLEPALYSPRILEAFKKEVGPRETHYPVHIKFNTGLNRLGFWENDVAWIAKNLGLGSPLEIKSIFSHLAATEDPNEVEFTRRQIAQFQKISEDFNQTLGIRPMRHLVNTSGILNYPEAHFDMVRSGIGLYGFGNDPQFDHHLRPIAQLKSCISQIHRIEPGESVGYNRAYKAPHYQTIATLPLGHADGIGRQYGNGKGYVTIQGKKAPIIGNVCMDMIMVDISGLECQEGDEVLVFGPESRADRLAETTQSISYELITGISQRITRKIIP
ncbi:alanine racemase [Sediminicola luteus]|uniref:Alanine racemase n=1 Tax=Sediminicola luteus TaxID=319238 RepID=A0A2A4G5P9_9FLAO|nr:alanine racemase [Sediminicola luteus]PCE63075.1 alanine racemase [Sediminicola luteus]